MIRGEHKAWGLRKRKSRYYWKSLHLCSLQPQTDSFRANVSKSPPCRDQHRCRKLQWPVIHNLSSACFCASRAERQTRFCPSVSYEHKKVCRLFARVTVWINNPKKVPRWHFQLKDNSGLLQWQTRVVVNHFVWDKSEIKCTWNVSNDDCTSSLCVAQIMGGHNRPRNSVCWLRRMFELQCHSFFFAFPWNSQFE